MRRTVQTVLVAFSLATSAMAQDSVPKEKPNKATGDISFVKTGGNTDVTTLGVSDKLEWKTSSRFTIKQNLGWVYGGLTLLSGISFVLAFRWMGQKSESRKSTVKPVQEISS
jgi:hypothetical protein